MTLLLWHVARAGKIKRSVDPVLATITLLGAIFYRRLVTSEPFNPDDASQLVKLVLG